MTVLYFNVASLSSTIVFDLLFIVILIIGKHFKVCNKINIIIGQLLIQSNILFKHNIYLPEITLQFKDDFFNNIFNTILLVVLK